MSKTTHTNPITGRTLKAENIEALDQAMRARRFSEPQWATFQQWKGTGRTVKPGETGVALEGSSGFTWRVFNISQTEGGEDQAEAPRVPAVIAPQPAAARPAARKAKSSARGGLSKVSSARGALAVTKATGLPAGWQRHPVTGHPMRTNAADVRDVIPFGHDPKALAMVRREHAKHGRIGAANVLVALELAGEKGDAAKYRKGLNDRRRGEGRTTYNRHMVLTETAALAKEIAAEFAAAAESAPAADAPQPVAPAAEPIDQPAEVVAAPAAPEAPQPAARPLTWRERWLAQFGHRFR